jgi:transcriptional regulator with XRE-family HTH domain/AraC-like DNA-binding protein
MRNPRPFDSWELAVPALPARSRLYSLAPIGVGTAFVEGLTSYVSRLAAAHSVSVGNLVGRELSDNGPGPLPLVHPSKRLQNGRSLFHGFAGASYSLNGAGDSPRLWIEVLEAKTCRRELRVLTLLPFEEILPDTKLFRKRRAWCPDCFRGWRKGGDHLYDPLLWSLRPVSFCPLHRQPLQERCPWCNRGSRPLASFTRPGHCSRCQRWLGVRSRDEASESALDQHQMRHAYWVATALGELLEATPRVPEGLMRAAFRKNLRGLVDRFAAGNATAFAQGLSISYSILDGWLNGKSAASLDGLLQLSENLNIAPINLITPGSALRNVDVKQIEKLMHDGPGHRRRFPNGAEIRRVLQEASKQVPPPPLTRLAHKLGFQDASRLYQIDAKLCRLIAKNYREFADSYWWRQPGAQPICTIEEMRDALEAALAADDPPSTKHLSRGLGYADDRLMRNRFPDLCVAVGAKRRKWKASLPARIRPTIEKALAEDPPPSLMQIAKRVGIGTLKALKKYYPNLQQKVASRQAAFRRARDRQRRMALEKALTENPAPCLANVAKRLRISKATLSSGFYNLCEAIGERYRMGFTTARVRD